MFRGSRYSRRALRGRRGSPGGYVRVSTSNEAGGCFRGELYRGRNLWESGNGRLVEPRFSSCGRSAHMGTRCGFLEPRRGRLEPRYSSPRLRRRRAMPGRPDGVGQGGRRGVIRGRYVRFPGRAGRPSGGGGRLAPSWGSGGGVLAWGGLGKAPHLGGVAGSCLGPRRGTATEPLPCVPACLLLAFRRGPGSRCRAGASSGGLRSAGRA